jgi:hypothetical protein
MSYYMGDYYQGGFFGSLFSGIKGLAGGLLGIPRSGGGGKTVVMQPAGPANPASEATQLGALLARGRGLASRHPVLSAAAAAGLGAAGLGSMALARRAKGKGLHPAVAAAIGGRRHKRMNPYNPRALRRAVRRAHAFSRMARKILRFTSPRAPKGHAFFKSRKRKRV